MWITFPTRLVKLLGAFVVFVLSSLVLLSTLTRKQTELRPLPAEEYRLISPHTYQYLLNQPDVCRDRSPFLVFMVPTGPHQAAAREAIRKTWGASAEDTLTLFYVGLPQGGQDAALQEELQEESRQHADIIQMNYVDTYRNLTIKTMMMMKWLATYCPYASYAMKVDIDVFVNVFYLSRYLRSSPRQGFITGWVKGYSEPVRNPSSKWYVSEELYPEDSYPPYISGSGYVFSADLAGRISWASSFVRPIPPEDVYVGLCLRLLGIRPVYSYSLLHLWNLFEIQKLEYDRCTFSKRIIVYGYQPPELLRDWPDFSKGHSSCWWPLSKAL